jgi:hypothetical protein
VVERVGQLWDRSLVRVVFTTVSVIVLLAGLVVYISSRDGVRAATTPGSALAATPSAAKLYGPEIKLPKQALATAQRFIQTAVLRADVAAAWKLTTAHVRGGLTRAQWDTGAIPVVPYPRQKFGGAKFKIDRSRQRDILLEVLLTSHKLGVAPIDQFIELVPRGGRWLVQDFSPRGVNPPVPAAQP